MSREPTQAIIEFCVEAITTIRAVTIQPGTEVTTIRPIATTTMGVGPHSNIIPDGYFYGNSPVIN